MSKLFKVLSIDGGGVRGIIPAQILTKIEECTGKHTYELFDLIVGTSIGGIIALELVVPEKEQAKPRYEAKKALKFYQDNCRKVFPPSKIPFASFIHATFIDEKYSAEGLESILKERLEDTKLGDALVPTILTSYDMKERKPQFFKSYRDKDKNYLMREVGRATSAAPTFFEAHYLEHPSYGNSVSVDGGVIANSPAMCAYAEAKKLNPEADIFLVSLGTGWDDSPYDYSEVKDWGRLEWILPLIHVMMDGMGATVDYQLRQLLSSERYYRFQLQLTGKMSDLDNTEPENIAALVEEADRMIQGEWKIPLKNLCETLVSN